MPALTPEAFGFRCEIEVSDDEEWPLVAFQEVLRAAKIEGEAGGGWGAQGDIEGTSRLLVGLSVLGFKKGAAVVSFAAFDPRSKKKKALAWSLDHADNPDLRRETRLSVYKQGKPLPLDADSQKRLKGVAPKAKA